MRIANEIASKSLWMRNCEKKKEDDSCLSDFRVSWCRVCHPARLTHSVGRDQSIETRFGTAGTTRPSVALVTNKRGMVYNMILLRWYFALIAQTRKNTDAATET